MNTSDRRSERQNMLRVGNMEESFPLSPLKYGLRFRDDIAREYGLNIQQNLRPLREELERRTSSEPTASTAAMIDIWRFSLDCDSSSLRRSFRTLSPDEKQKADRFRFAKDHDRYVVARGSLRRIIGGYLGLEPDQIRFSYNRFGKPFIDDQNVSIRFNVSHSRDIALIAVTSGKEVGIDIEFIDNDLDILTTAKGIFSTTELSILEKLTPELRTRAFFKAWTRKEAYLKALGKGFSDESGQFPVSILMDEQKFVFITNDGLRSRKWSLMSLPSARNYSSALVVEGEIETTRNRQLPKE